jgi:6-phosphogluconolactonase (cycloisomerase 2 family)
MAFEPPQSCWSNSISRRRLLKASAALSVVPGVAAQSAPGGRTAKGSVLAYVGTYSSPQGPEGSKGRGQGIYRFRMNTSDGSLSEQKLFADDSNPSWLAFSPSRDYLFAANETSTYQGTKSGSVSAFQVDRSSGDLKLLNTVSSEGAGPAHLSVHPSGKYVFVANYYGGTITVLPVGSNGELGKPTDIKKDEGKLGPIHAQSAPAGSFAISGHDHPHAHMILPDPSGRFVLATDLALDKIYVWKFNADNGKLSENNPASVSVPPGDGPRHFTFHPNKRWMYSLQEEGSTLIFFEYDGAQGRLTEKQTISSLPKGVAGTNFTSEVVVSPDGRFVYAANRLHDSIAFFAISPTGTLTFAGETWTRGDYPRSFTIDPTGNFLYSCNQRSDVIATFRVNKKTGDLTFTGQYTPVGTPAIVVFLT